MSRPIAGPVAFESDVRRLTTDPDPDVARAARDTLEILPAQQR
jgi:hypothetical protein